jgi:hypothetical protein
VFRAVCKYCDYETEDYDTPEEVIEQILADDEGYTDEFSVFDNQTYCPKCGTIIYVR